MITWSAADGKTWDSYAEFMRVPVRSVSPMPKSLNFAQAAAVPVAAVCWLDADLVARCRSSAVVMFFQEFQHIDGADRQPGHQTSITYVRHDLACALLSTGVCKSARNWPRSTQCISMWSASACGIRRPHPVGLNLNPQFSCVRLVPWNWVTTQRFLTWAALVNHALR